MGPHRTIGVVAADPRRERLVAHTIRNGGRRAEAVSGVATVAAPSQVVKRRNIAEDSVRRMRPQWSGRMRGALGRPDGGPTAATPHEEAWAEPTADDEEAERMMEGWVWEEEDKGDG